jgi:ankyrin repeat protein
MRWGVVLVLLVGCVATDPSRAVTRALPLLQATQDTWAAKQHCSSCHHQGVGLMAVAVARERGFPVDESSLAHQVARIDLADLEEELVTGFGLINGQFTVSYLTTALGTLGVPGGPAIDRAMGYLAGKQGPDGRWSSESHRPPLEDSDVTATALAVRALSLYAPDEMKERIARATAWLAAKEPRHHEDRAYQLLGLRWGGAPYEVRKSRANDLLGHQRDDGGWAQLPSRESDAYATGLALVALHVGAELPVDDPAYRLGVAFLERTQEDDGSWRVPTRRKLPGLPHFETGFPHGPDQFISTAGTAWAVMAIALSARPRRDVALLRGPITKRAHAAPVAAALAPFAVLGDAKALGRLLERGTKADTKSPSGVTLLMAAVARSDGLEATKLLLARGADPNATGPAGMTPLMFAVSSGGDLERVRLLLEAGARLSARDAQGGTVLGWAMVNWKVDALGLLLERGGDARAIDWMKMPLLSLAVADRELPVIELLLRHRADPNAADSEGMTPLHWAAVVDSGDGRIVQALLAAGADRARRTPKGETARDLAEKHGNRHILSLL